MKCPSGHPGLASGVSGDLQTGVAPERGWDNINVQVPDIALNNPAEVTGGSETPPARDFHGILRLELTPLGGADQATAGPSSELSGSRWIC